MSQLILFAAPLGRILIALIFLIAGFNKLTDFSTTQAYMSAMGVPGILLPIVILTEIGGAIAIIIGWNTRVTAFLLAGFTLLSALFFHSDFSEQTNMLMFMKNAAIAGGFLMITANGAGAYSLDARHK